MYVCVCMYRDRKQNKILIINLGVSCDSHCIIHVAYVIGHLYRKHFKMIEQTVLQVYFLEALKYTIC